MIIFSPFFLDVTSVVGSGMPVITSVTSIVSVVSISSIAACSGTLVSSVGSTRIACEIPVFPVGSAFSVISLGTASSVVVFDFSLCSAFSVISLGTSVFRRCV